MFADRSLVLKAFAIFSAICAGDVTAVAQEILLKNGNRIGGVVLQERADKVFVDLGYTILSVPRDEIASIEKSPNAAGTAGKDTALVVGDALFIEDPSREQMDVRANVDRCGESVVQVRSATGLGSGFIINTLGHVITNNHVVSGERELQVTVYKKTAQGLQKVEYEKVRILATSPLFDLALLQIDHADAGTFRPLPVGDSEKLAQGQTVFAIGSPLGLERTVSQGIVSLRNREIDGRVYIQTTVQINPGNSGGPLLNLRGEVVGVNNMKAALMGVEGLAFAIPSSVLKFFLQNRDAFAFDARNPNAGFRYLPPPGASPAPLVPPASENKEKVEATSNSTPDQ